MRRGCRSHFLFTLNLSTPRQGHLLPRVPTSFAQMTLAKLYVDIVRYSYLHSLSTTYFGSSKYGTCLVVVQDSLVVQDSPKCAMGRVFAAKNRSTYLLLASDSTNPSCETKL